MRSAVHARCLFLLKVKDKDFPSLPAPHRTEENEIVIQVPGHLGYVPEDVFNEPSTQALSQDPKATAKKSPKVRTKDFTWNWKSSWQHPFNKLISGVFYRTFRLAL
ncbi:hypothetical protein O181_020283 [Austropuccinia psidii MF-1]|uniref:Uncharacterized protein n=1 Tax=Austropuccinia psidii MF-1 TaxID=1389203 RepID=A0A9Q3CCM3_9BASI|nr:hypothetical protein [Austropuccinia psidii MF-1]